MVFVECNTLQHIEQSIMKMNALNLYVLLISNCGSTLNLVRLWLYLYWQSKYFLKGSFNVQTYWSKSSRLVFCLQRKYVAF